MLRRIACIDIPDLPLQILLKRHPDWLEAPVALIAEDRPEAELLLINRHARVLRLRTGMRFGAAKSLVPELRAGTVSALEVEEVAAQLVKDLQTFSPHVERDPMSAGVFYVDPSGLAHLYGGELSWARAVHRYLRGRHFYAAAVVGYGRALSYALSRVTRGVRVFDTPEQTLAQALEVPLMRLHIDPKLRDALERLGLSTLGDLRGFGADQLGVRFGAEAARLGRVARGEEVLSLCREVHADTPRIELEVDPPDDDVARLCFVLKRALDLLLEEVRRRGQSVRALWMRLSLMRSPECAQRLEPSAPTRDGKLLLELLRLRLSTLRLDSPVVEVALEAETSDLAQGQLSMFVPKRDLAAGERALARLKASFGEDVVCRAELVDAHLPEAQFRWVPVTGLSLPRGEEREEGEEVRPLVRRFLRRPELLAVGEGDGEAAHALDDVRDRGERERSRARSTLLHAGQRLTLTGPYRISGGWWAREVARDYYYARSESGALSWIFYDALRESWFLQATVD
jgi:protein ImuB